MAGKSGMSSAAIRHAGDNEFKQHQNRTKCQKDRRPICPSARRADSSPVHHSSPSSASSRGRRKEQPDAEQRGQNRRYDNQRMLVDLNLRLRLENAARHQIQQIVDIQQRRQLRVASTITMPASAAPTIRWNFDQLPPSGGIPMIDNAPRKKAPNSHAPRPARQAGDPGDMRRNRSHRQRRTA